MDRNYEELAIIGRGAYGTVFKARDVENDRTVALKRVRIVNNTDEKGVPVSTLREITLLKQLDNYSHPNIVRMFDAFQTYSENHGSDGCESVLTIVFEHVDQDLSMFLQKYPAPALPEQLIKDLMYQMLSGLDYLHINRLIHRDIKPQNILITKNKQVKIADFGLARVYGFCKLITSVVVTLWYRSPELLLQCPYATLVDLWSVGAIMAEMYNRRPLFPGKSDVDQLQKVINIIGAPEQKEWPEKSSLPWKNFMNCKGINLRHLVPDISSEGFDLLKGLLVFDPSKRFNAQQSLAHPYFDDIDRGDSQDSGISSQILSEAEQIEEAKKSILSLSSSETVDSGVSSFHDSSAHSDYRSLSRTDSGICVSPTLSNGNVSNADHHDCCSTSSLNDCINNHTSYEAARESPKRVFPADNDDDSILKPVSNNNDNFAKQGSPAGKKHDSLTKNEKRVLNEDDDNVSKSPPRKLQRRNEND